MTDEMRRELTIRLDAGEEFAVEVSFQRWSRGGQLLHASFCSLRADKTRTDCGYYQQRVLTDPIYARQKEKEDG